jgi:hypothetical protein
MEISFHVFQPWIFWPLKTFLPWQCFSLTQHGSRLLGFFSTEDFLSAFPLSHCSLPTLTSQAIFLIAVERWPSQGRLPYSPHLHPLPWGPLSQHLDFLALIIICYNILIDLFIVCLSHQSVISTKCEGHTHFICHPLSNLENVLGTHYSH